MAGRKVRVHMEKSSEAHVRFPIFVYQNTKRLQRGNRVISILCIFGFSKSTIVNLLRLYFPWARKKV